MRLEYFQMIDRVAEVGDDSTRPDFIRVESRVPDASPVFEGHFPGHPLVPGVLLVETMAQTGGWLILARNGFAAMPFLMNVKEAKFRSFVGPGAPLDVTSRLTHDGSGYAVTEARITSEGKRIAEAEITLRTMPFPHPDLEAAMRANAVRIGLPGYVPA